MSGWIDVSRPVSETTPVWPGDLPWSLTPGALHGTTHAGTHADAPLHVDPDGDPVDRLSLDAFLGPAWVVDVGGSPGVPIPATELEEAVPAGAERVLLRTGCDWSSGFPTSFRGLTPEAADWCAARGLRLLGTDAPSVDPYDSDALPAHRALVRGGVAILESLDLAGAPPGGYALVALPLRLVGADASPVRAALRPI